MISNKQIIQPGVRVGKAYTGRHQGVAHVADGVYWEAMYHPSEDEKKIQTVLTDPRYIPTQQAWGQAIRTKRVLDRARKFVPTEIR